jgi:branched-subunit amino acid aminotransferase/4-amino-4-deoxychorismate lyase
MGSSRGSLVKLSSHLLKKNNLRQRSVTQQVMDRFSEVFLTSPTKEVVPVTQIDGIHIGHDPGSVTEKVMELFQHYTQAWR